MDTHLQLLLARLQGGVRRLATWLGQVSCVFSLCLRKSLLTFAPEILCLPLDVDRVSDVNLELVPVSGNEPVEAPVGGVQQLEFVWQENARREVASLLGLAPVVVVVVVAFVDVSYGH